MYKALIIGCGNIGAGYDFDNNQILTHAKAFSLNTNFTFSIFDLDKMLTEKISKKYQCEVVNEINAKTLSSFDCVCICVTTPYHFQYLLKTFEAKNKLVICEKPVSYSLLELEQLNDIYHQSSSKILVNYIRRFQPLYFQLKQKIKPILIQECLTNISIRYYKGFINNCSHAFDIIEFLIDKSINLSDIKKHNVKNDYFDNDPTLSLQAKWENVNMNIDGLTNLCFSEFEIDLYFQFHKVKISESGQTIEVLNSNNNTLVSEVIYKNCLKNYMEPIVNKAYEILNDKSINDNFIQSINLNKQMLNYINI